MHLLAVHPVEARRRHLFGVPFLLPRGCIERALRCSRGGTAALVAARKEEVLVPALKQRLHSQSLPLLRH